MFRWILAFLAAVGLIGPKATTAPTTSPSKSSEPSKPAPRPIPQDCTSTDGQPAPPPGCQ